MRDTAGAEERTRAGMGAVDELIDQHEGAGGQLRFERPAGGKRDQIGHARALEHVDIGAIIDVARRSSTPDGLPQGLSMILLCALVSPG
jgi:hypothetical protein